MKTVTLLALGLIALATMGCETLTTPPAVEASNWNGVIASSIAVTTAGGEVNPVDNRPLRKDCTECNGTGRVKTGDGIAWTTCDACKSATAAEELASTLALLNEQTRETAAARADAVRFAKQLEDVHAQMASLTKTPAQPASAKAATTATKTKTVRRVIRTVPANPPTRYGLFGRPIYRSYSSDSCGPFGCPAPN